jgi:hypothetical protein
MDQKHSSKKSAQSSIPSKSMLDFLTRATRQVKKAAKRKRPKGRGSAPTMGNVVSSTVVDVPAARVTRLANGRIGLADRRREWISFQTGGVYTGLTGTLGGTGSVYFSDLTGTIWNGIMPVLIRDTDGYRVPSFVEDSVKHFARESVHKCLVDFLPTSSSTGTGTTVLAGPVRGADFPPGASATSGALAENPPEDVLGMAGSCQFGSWERQTLDLSSMIAGGSGANQNEFSLSNAGWKRSVGTATPLNFANGGIAGFALSGEAAAGDTGRQTHRVIVRLLVDLLDFIGGFAAAGPVIGSKIKHPVDEKKQASVKPEAPSDASGGRALSRPPPLRRSELEDTPTMVDRPDSRADSNVKSAPSGSGRPGWFG